MGLHFSKPIKLSEAEKAYRAEQEARWAKQRQANTEWVVAELTACWEEGRKKGRLSIKYNQSPDEVKSIMREKGIDVFLTHEGRPLDIDEIHDKTHFIMSKIVSNV